jgi:hypothetical protein
VDGNFNFPVSSMNRLNQTKPATFSILSRWAFFMDSVFIYFKYVNIWNLAMFSFFKYNYILFLLFKTCPCRFCDSVKIVLQGRAYILMSFALYEHSNRTRKMLALHFRRVNEIWFFIALISLCLWYVINWISHSC